MSIMHKIEELLKQRHMLEEQGASPQAVETVQEVIDELLAKAGCFCESSQATTVEELRTELGSLQFEALINNTHISQCPIHGPVIARRELQDGTQA